MTTVTLSQLRQDARDSKLKVGDLVVFAPMGGIWGDLCSLTGTILKKNKDPIWRYDVEVQFPHLLYDPTCHTKKGTDDFITTVGPTAVQRLSPKILKTLKPETMAKLNKGSGLVPTSPEMSKHVTLRQLWLRIREMDEEQMEKYSDRDWFQPQKKRTESDIKYATKRMAALTAKIKKLKKLGFVEPSPLCFSKG